MILNIAQDFSPSPGHRLDSQGDFSGESFRENHLIPMLDEAIHNDVKLTIILDGGVGYAVSFLDESFGELSNYYNKEEVLNRIEFISDEEPYLIEDINEIINESYGD